MKALSVKPPWAQFIVYGIPLFMSFDNGDGTQSVKPSGKVIYKDVENRTWAIGRNPHHGPYQKQQANFTIELPCRIYIQAGKKEDKFEDVVEFCCKGLGFPVGTILSMTSPLLGRGAILGEVDIIDCIRDSKSSWAIPGQNHFVLKNPLAYKTPVTCSGQLGFFEPGEEIERRIRELNET